MRLAAKGKKCWKVRGKEFEVGNHGLHEVVGIIKVFIQEKAFCGIEVNLGMSTKVRKKGGWH